MKIIWKNHPVYSNYEVSNNGQIRLWGRVKTRKTRLDKYGYLRINISFNGKHKTVSVHKMVAETFLEKPFDAATVNHIDWNKLNNSVSNLEWISVEDNTRHGAKKPNHKKCVPVMVHGKIFYSKREAERRTGVPRWSL